MAIRALLVKGRSSGDAVYAAVEEVANELRERISHIYQVQKQPAGVNGTGISPARVKTQHEPLSKRVLTEAHLLIALLLCFISSLKRTR